MKKTLMSISTMLFLAILVTSCGEEMDGESTVDCNFEDEILSVQPICSFDPRIATTVPFPVNVLVDGMAADSETYNFSWSTNLDFTGSAISVTYDQLPLIATLTEVETGCTAEVILEGNYWD